MRTAPILLSIAAIAALRAETAGAPPPMSDADRRNRSWERFNTASIVANVDGEAITAQEIRQMIRGAAQQLHEEAKSQQEYDTRLEALRNEVITQLVNNLLVTREFKERGMQFPASVVASEVEEKITRDFGGDRTEYLRSLRMQGRTPLQDRAEIERKIVIDYLTAQVRKSVGALSPEKIQRYYESNKDGFRQQAAIKVSQIALWADSTETDAEVRARAADIVARLNKGENFAELAKKFSKDDFREQGGDAGWKDLASLSDHLVKSLTALTDGAYSAPIELNAGGRLSVFIIRRDAFRPEGPRPVSEVREIIEGKLMVDATRVAVEDWYQRMRDHFYVRVYE